MTLGVLVFDDVLVKERSQKLGVQMVSLTGLATVSTEVDVTARVYTMYRRLGSDFTKTVRFLVVIFVPYDVEISHWTSTLTLQSMRLAEFAAAKVVERSICMS